MPPVLVCAPQDDPSWAGVRGDKVALVRSLALLAVAGRDQQQQQQQQQKGKEGGGAEDAAPADAQPAADQGAGAAVALPEPAALRVRRRSGARL
jgi:hypothetical protein